MPQKFWTLCDRYVDGRYIRADPEHPAPVVFPDRYKIKLRPDGKTPEDGTLKPYTEEPPAEKLAKPFAEVRKGPPDKKSHERDRSDGRRPSDIDPAEQ